jgi:flavin reductase (DIM6/NTAB) family NADH-FMN oxidoreductase RutF
MSKDESRTAFERIVGELDYPMLIVTTVERDLAGCLVGFHTQCSIMPPRYLVCLSKTNFTYRLARSATAMAVHFVPSGADDLARLFGEETGDEVDKFARCEWHPGPAGLPVLDACPNWFAGQVLERLDLGDHAGLLLAPFAGEAQAPGETYPFHRARRMEPGHEP